MVELIIPARNGHPDLYINYLLPRNCHNPILSLIDTDTRVGSEVYKLCVECGGKDTYFYLKLSTERGVLAELAATTIITSLVKYMPMPAGCEFTTPTMQFVGRAFTHKEGNKLSQPLTNELVQVTSAVDGEDIDETDVFLQHPASIFTGIFRSILCGDVDLSALNNKQTSDGRSMFDFEQALDNMPLGLTSVNFTSFDRISAAINPQALSLEASGGSCLELAIQWASWLVAYLTFNPDNIDINDHCTFSNLFLASQSKKRPINKSVNLLFIALSSFSCLPDTVGKEIQQNFQLTIDELDGEFEFNAEEKVRVAKFFDSLSRKLQFLRLNPRVDPALVRQFYLSLMRHYNLPLDQADLMEQFDAIIRAIRKAVENANHFNAITDNIYDQLTSALCNRSFSSSPNCQDFKRIVSHCLPKNEDTRELQSKLDRLKNRCRGVDPVDPKALSNIAQPLLAIEVRLLKPHLMTSFPELSISAVKALAQLIQAKKYKQNKVAVPTASTPLFTQPAFSQVIDKKGHCSAFASVIRVITATNDRINEQTPSAPSVQEPSPKSAATIFTTPPLPETKEEDGSHGHEPPPAMATNDPKTSKTLTMK